MDRGKEGLMQTIFIKEIPLIFNWNTVRLLSYNHTKRQVERQAACQVARSYWNAL